MSEEIADADRDLRVLIARTAPSLLALTGVGTETAGQLLVTAGDNPDRLASEASFAHLFAAAPVPASSGRTDRHRLSRGGDRQTKRALHTIVLVRMRHDPRTRDYVARRTLEGLKTKDIFRCLKRFVAREIEASESSSEGQARQLRPPTLRTSSRWAGQDSASPQVGLGKAREELPWWKEGARDVAEGADIVSVGTGFISAGLGVVGIFAGVEDPVGAALETSAGVFADISIASAGVNTIFTGIGWGLDSPEFKQSLGNTSLALITFGQSKWLQAAGAGKAVPKISQFAHDLVSPVTWTLGKIFGDD
ncbi:IS110 family transposase [Streptomyces sp. NPDC051994]|uniref:IS110 family transposase n=1 Tax=unclassified Streptomyces TaxID=2593676 RepID=UPI003448408C